MPQSSSHNQAVRWLVSQIGARQHYAIPRGFHERGELRQLYTNIWCRYAADWCKRGPGPLRALAGRYHPDLPSNKVSAFTPSAMYRDWRDRRDNRAEAGWEGHLRIGHWYAQRVNRRLSRLRLDPAIDTFFAFNTGALESLRLMRDRGIFSVVDQIDPARVEEEIIYRESEKWPGWQRVPGRIPERYFAHLTEEWTTASAVLVNSDWSRNALIQQGVAPEKIFIVPISFEEKARPIERRLNEGKMRVLWLGGVNLRKGIPYLMEAARQLKDRNIEFQIAGPSELSDEVMRAAPSNMIFMGRISRTDTAELYRQGDVFVLPTLSDGFALTQLEAMARGMPVIATPNCGKVVTDGVDGLIVPASNADDLARAIARLDDDRALLLEMSQNALVKIRQFTPAANAARINAAVARMRQGLPAHDPNA